MLAARSMGPIANFVDKSGGTLVHHRRVMFLQMCQKRALDVIRFTDVDPLARVSDSIDSGSRRSVHLNRDSAERPGNQLHKGHRTSIPPKTNKKRGGSCP